jgi:hypothetical protein
MRRCASRSALLFATIKVAMYFLLTPLSAWPINISVKISSTGGFMVTAMVL